MQAILKFNSPSFEDLSNKEWLVTNGLGGYASSTLSGANTRRYHGIMVPAMDPPTGRMVIVSKIEETLITPRGSWTELSSNCYPGVIHPQGYRYLLGFERLPIPTFHYQVDENSVTKRICMPFGSNTTVVEYTNTGTSPITLEARPLFVHRDYHSLYSENAEANFWTEWDSPMAARIYAHYGAPVLYFRFSHGEFKSQPSWYKNFEYEKEAYRGLDHREDCKCLGVVAALLNPSESLYLVFTHDEQMLSADPAELVRQEIARIIDIGKAVPEADQQNGSPHVEPVHKKFYRDLVIAADQFIVNRKSSDGHTIIAGYHWFTDWGRDTMIAMRGLVIAPGKKALAESIIRTFLQYLDKGMLPNRFPDHGEQPEYNTIDATLWLFVVLHEYVGKFDDWKFIQQVLPRLAEILEAHLAGTRFNIHVTEQGLLFGGEGISQLTWMDARIGDHVVTPRHGCPVEINALWYNAVMIYNTFSAKLGVTSKYDKLAGRIKKSFIKYFFNGNYLNDVVIPDEYVDDTIRPNQVYALSLPYRLLNHAQERKVLDIVREKLLTPLGLRSLDPAHPDFIAVYGGDQWHRDTAYHQGTVWAFLLGEYCLAYLNIYGDTDKVKADILHLTEGLREHFYKNDCIHGISEIFDGKSPGDGRGCIQQAWSVGMILKVLTDIGIHPYHPVSTVKRKLSIKK